MRKKKRKKRRINNKMMCRGICSKITYSSQGFCLKKKLRGGEREGGREGERDGGKRRGVFGSLFWLRRGGGGGSRGGLGCPVFCFCVFGWGEEENGDVNGDVNKK